MGWERPDVQIVSTNPSASPCFMSWSGGIQLNGSCWSREDDVLGLAIGQLFPSVQYSDAGNGGAGEGHFEAYYRCQLNPHLAVSPDIQVIWNPLGISHGYQGDNTTIWVYGLRGQVDF